MRNDGNFQPKKVVITGALGFIGSHVLDYFHEAYDQAEFVIVDKITYAADVRNSMQLQSNDPRVRLEASDICDLEKMTSVLKDCDLLLHLAAESHVSRSFNNSFVFTRSNTLGTHSILEAARRSETPRLIHVSTDEVYGELAEGKFCEDANFNPTNPYSASKAGAEMLVKSYFYSFGVPVKVVRANNIFGTRQFPEKIIPRFILRALQNAPLTLHGDGSNRRHYLSATDFAKALHAVIEKGEVGEAYNVASTQEFTNREIANRIIKVATSSSEIVYVEDRPFNDARYAIDDSKLRALGWAENDSLTLALPLLVKWYEENRNRWPEETYLS